MTKTKDKRSDAIKLLDLVWANTNSAVSHSWERLNHSMRAALQLTIGAGFVFAEGDLKEIATGKYRFGYWSSDSVEWIYALAVAAENTSAIKSFEAWLGRTPFIADDVTFSSNGGYAHGNYVTRKRERLVDGASFEWQGVKVKVTSFAADNSYVTCCSYKRIDKGGYSTEKVERRFKITRDDIIADRAERKERAELLARLTAACRGSTETIATITKALGTNNAKAVAALPLEKVRKVADKYAPKQPPELLITKVHHAAARAAGCCGPAVSGRYTAGCT